MVEAGLDPLVARTMAEVLACSNETALHPNDVNRWMGVLLVMARDGLRWDMDNIDDWLQENWPHPDDEDALESTEALKVYAWAMMALAVYEPSEPFTEAERIVNQCADEFGR